MSIHRLTDRAVIQLSGKDTRHLLQGIITNNIELLDTQHIIFSALLSPQGKFAFDFLLIAHDDALLLDVHHDDADALIRKLSMYRLRADMQITKLEGWHVYADTQPHDGWLTDPRHAGLGARHYTQDVLEADTLEDYHAHRLQFGIPEGAYDAVPDKSLLLELGYDQLHAIDFHKGCYVGQEVTARSKHRGTLRKYLHHVRGEHLPEAGSEIVTEAGTPIGIMRSSAGGVGLAVLHAEKLEAANSITANGHLLTASPLPWLER